MTFFKEPIDDEAHVASWFEPAGTRWLAVAGDEVLGYVAVVALHGWSSHVGEIRLIVDPAHRGEGVGSALAKHVIVAASEVACRSWWWRCWRTRSSRSGCFARSASTPRRS